MRMGRVIALRLNRYRTGVTIGLVLLAIAAGQIILVIGHVREGGIKETTFASLSTIRNQKKSELASHLKKMHALACGITEDSVMTDFFLDQCYERAPQKTISTFPQVDRQFLDQYGKFYDILFVDTTGFVFHSIRQESDYKTTIGTDFEHTRLSRRLLQCTEPSFMEFEQYLPSSEPAAFHVIPFHYNSTLAGYFVLQQSVNRVNNIMIDRDGMGRTGEVYLVDNDGLMLTDSRFDKESTILRKSIMTDATRFAQLELQGNGIIKDYRGVNVFSSFEKFDLLGTSWVIVAEIDEDEVLTDYLSSHLELIHDNVDTYRLSPRSHDTSRVDTRAYVKVDMDEFMSTHSNDRLRTFGVSTCTAVAISFPGRFSYLAHVSPIDKSYSNSNSRLFDFGTNEDIMERMLSQIHRFEIYSYEIDSLRFTVVSPQTNSFKEISRRLIAFGADVGQIRYMHDPEKLYANVTIESDATVSVEWIGQSPEDVAYAKDKSARTLRDVIIEISGYDRETTYGQN
ncbi:MAG: cache domain-containing protein [candidate division Zixibacteria bacterium]